MAFWLLLSVIAVSWLLGRAALRILYGKQTLQEPDNLADSFLTGGIMIIGLAQAAHLGTLLLGRSFSDCVKMFWFFAGVCTAGAFVWELCIRRKSPKREKTGRSLKELGRAGSIYLVFALLVLSQLIYIAASGEVYLQGDMTVETVNSFLASDTIYQVNPLTGQAYEAGIPLRLRVLCLPTLYAILCRTFGIPAVQLVWTLIPMLTLAGAYLAYQKAAEVLFPERGIKRGVFLVFAALILWAGDYMYGMDGFGLLHSGFRGVVIRSLVLLPYTFGLCMRRRWRTVWLCILAEACIVWTLYGMGACLFAAAGMLLLQKFAGRKKTRADGKESSACRNF